MDTYEIEFHVPAPRSDVYAFVSNVENLDRMTPAWLRFFVKTPRPVEVRLGTVIDYALRWRGLPMRWRSEITDWRPLSVFTYEQRRGPYGRWIHEHEFYDEAGGTRVVDRVHYALPGPAWLSRTPIGRRVARDVETIFQHRAGVLAQVFPAREQAAGG